MALGVDFRSWDPASWAAAGTWVTALVYGALLIYAVRQFGEARRLREQQIRPFVVVDFDVDWLTDLRIENVGSIIAYDVRMTFTPALTSTFDHPWPWENSPLFDNGIPTLVPGKAIRVPFDSYNARHGSGLDMSYSVEVSYADYRGKRFTDPCTLDLGIYENTNPPDDGLPELIKAVDKVSTELTKWTDGIRGLRVNVSDRDKSEARQVRAVMVQRAKQVKAEDGWRAFAQHLGRRFLVKRGWIRR